MWVDSWAVRSVLLINVPIFTPGPRCLGHYSFVVFEVRNAIATVLAGPGGSGGSHRH